MANSSEHPPQQPNVVGRLPASRSSAAPPARGAQARVLLRRSIRLSYVAAMLWACGNVVTSGLVLTFLAQELGADGNQVAALHTAPALFGILRLLTPLAIVRFGGTKRTVLTLSAAAYALLFMVPGVVELGRHAERRTEVLAPLIAILCAHQVLEQMATVALWTWLTDMIPRRFRGRYFSRRNMLQLAVVIVSLLVSGLGIDYVIAAEKTAAAADAQIVPYAPAYYGAMIFCGAALLMTSLVPLALVAPYDATAPNPPRLRALFASFFDPAARRLLIYGCWFSFFNGLFIVAQNIFPKGVLKLGLGDVNAMQTTMRLGQIGVSAWAGPASDRCGNRPVVVLCQLLVGAAPLFYFLASPENPYRLYGAWILWSAYAGINICVPNLALRLAPADERASHYATYQAVTSLFLVAGTLAGGSSFQSLGRDFTLQACGISFDKFALFFLGAFVLRSAGAALVARVPEPGAKRVVDLFICRRE